MILYEKFLPTLRDRSTNYQHCYADISALTLPNRFRMLLYLHRHPEVHARLLFGTDYPLPVFHFPCWGRVAPGTMWDLIRATNRFERQVLVCNSLGLGFGSFSRALTSRA